MEQAQKIIVMSMSREELIALFEEVITRLLNLGNSGYPSREEGAATKVFTRNEVATILKKTANTVSKYIRQKKLHASVFNGVYYISENSLLTFINQKSKC